MLDSLFSLMREHNFTYEDVANAEVDQSFYSVVMLYQEPEDSLKGKFSAKYNVAAALVDSEIGIETFRDEKIDDPKIQETMDRCEPGSWQSRKRAPQTSQRAYPSALP